LAGDEAGEGWDVGEEADLELPPDLLETGGTGSPDTKRRGAKTGGEYVAPSRGTNPRQHWTNQSRLPADHVAAGSFESAFRYGRYCGITNLVLDNMYICKFL